MTWTFAAELLVLYAKNRLEASTFMVPKAKECDGGCRANAANHPNPGMTPFRIIKVDHAGMQGFHISNGCYGNVRP